MKDGICPMCRSDEVYMNEDEHTLFIGGPNTFGFMAGEDRAANIFDFDTYVCLNCGYTALFAKAHFHNPESQGLATLKNAKGWNKAG